MIIVVKITSPHGNRIGTIHVIRQEHELPMSYHGTVVVQIAVKICNSGAYSRVDGILCHGFGNLGRRIYRTALFSILSRIPGQMLGPLSEVKGSWYGSVLPTM